MEVKLTGKPLDQRISDRLRNSGEGAGRPSVVVKKGEGPTRTFTSIHLGAGHVPPKSEGDR